MLNRLNFFQRVDMQPYGCIYWPMMDKVFRALADPSRRKLLDSLFRQGSQTLSDLSSELAMTRQAVTKHLRILEEATLVSIAWHGREKHHSLNPLPIQMVMNRWIRKFERGRLDALLDLKDKLEGESDAGN